MIPSTMHFMLDIILDVYGYHVSTLQVLEGRRYGSVRTWCQKFDKVN